jgi:GNAT superfamily N-acetyltransferase
MSEYSFERLSKDNLKDLIFLYKTAFNEITDISFLEKKYNTSFFGLSYVGFIAYHQASKTPAAYYGVFPIKLQKDGKELLAAQSGDTMTHPDHRGKGLFVSLANETYKLAKELGVHFIFGFPNENSYPGFVKKLNWKHYSNVNHYKFKGSSIPMDKIAKKIPALRAIHKAFFPQPNTTKLHFANSLGYQFQSMGNIKHDLSFFKYKCYAPSFIVEIAGIKCWLKVDGRVWVGDIEFCNESEFEKVIDGLIAFTKRKFCSTLMFSVMKNSVYDQRLKKRATSGASIAVGCLDLSGQYTPENFVYQAGDFDTF